ncbi:hypothetical protein EKN06_00135 [Croceicoccus ponticola]|uniref:VOC domain-containing protein n=1 Tax=Croceicoccus ponticola TaxID=2217664 RepID=A0A437GZB8_9SPHN|nr:VOC family protein [Croceicoccus ponticola]RVQ68682.1 hypothetical protein EKN06_00135 [Croceicoccus ponticola]
MTDLSRQAPFGSRVEQLGYLVDDLDAAMAHWTGTLGAGPFFVLPERRFVELAHGGVACDEQMIAGVAMGQLGPVQIELIVPGGGPSTYHRFLGAGGRGLHHLGYIADDYVAARQEAVDGGLRIATEGRSQATRFCYIENEAALAEPCFELIEACDVINDVFAMVARAHAEWDGSEPVRYL